MTNQIKLSNTIGQNVTFTVRRRGQSDTVAKMANSLGEKATMGLAEARDRIKGLVANGWSVKAA